MSFLARCWSNASLNNDFFQIQRDRQLSKSAISWRIIFAPGNRDRKRGRLIYCTHVERIYRLTVWLTKVQIDRSYIVVLLRKWPRIFRFGNWNVVEWVFMSVVKSTYRNLIITCIVLGTAWVEELDTSRNRWHMRFLLCKRMILGDYFYFSQSNINSSLIVFFRGFEIFRKSSKKFRQQSPTFILFYGKLLHKRGQNSQRGRWVEI